MSGMPFALLHDTEYIEEADIELCLPVKKKLNSSVVAIKTLPAAKAVCTTHMGKYDLSGFAYKAVLDYMAEKQLSPKAPSREIYLKGPGMLFKGNESKYVTEIQISYEEENHA